MSSGILDGNVFMARLNLINLTPASVAANTTVEQTFTIPGVNFGDLVSFIKPTLQAGLSVVQARSTAANTVAITYSNNTGGAIVPTAENYPFFQARPEGGIPKQL